MATMPGIPGGSSSGLSPASMNPSQGFPGYGIPGSGGGSSGSNWGMNGGMPMDSSFPVQKPGYTGMGTPYNSDIWGGLYKGMRDVYGNDMGNMLAYYITQGAGFNQGAINQLFAAMDPTISRSLATIGASTGVSGTRFGSAHDFGTADYLSQVYLDQGQIEAQMYEESQNRIASMLQKGGDYAASTSSGPGLMNQIMGGLQMAGPAVGAGMAAGGASGGWATIAAALMAL